MNKVKQQIHYWCEDTVQGKIRGEGVAVAVLDTGIAVHPDLRGKVVMFQDCVNHRQGMYDGRHHCGRREDVAGEIPGDRSRGAACGH